MGFLSRADIRMMWVSAVSGGTTTAYRNILGSGNVLNANPVAVDTLLGCAYCQEYNHLSLYSIDGWVNTATSKWSATNKNVLRDFIANAHAIGIKVGAALGPGNPTAPEGYLYDAIADYNASVASFEKFDFLTTEDEYFNYSFDNPARSTSPNHDHSFLSFKAILVAKRAAMVAAGVKIFHYIGWVVGNGNMYPDGSVVTGGNELAQLQNGGPGATDLVDLYMLHDYVDIPHFSYMESRVAMFDPTKDVDVAWIVSAEQSFSRAFFAGQVSPWSAGGTVSRPLRGPDDCYDYITKILGAVSPAQSLPCFETVQAIYPKVHVRGIAVFSYQQLVDDTHKVLSKNGARVYVTAGPDQTLPFSAGNVALTGKALDDLLPDTTLTLAWSVTSGPSGGSFSPSNTAATIFSWTNPGTYVLRLTATDGGSVSSHAEMTLTITSPPMPPVANFSGSPTSVLAGLTVAFTDASTNTPASWLWTFPGGVPSTSTAQNPSVVYNVPGVYNVTLQVTNADGSDTLTRAGYITVSSIPPPPPAPVADFLGSPLSIIQGGTVSFLDASSNSPTSWAWTFSGGIPSSSSSQNPSVVYNTPGVYDVVLLATNANGSDTKTRTGYVTVLPTPPPPPPPGPEVTEVILTDQPAIAGSADYSTKGFYVVRYGQTLYDVCLQTYGTLGKLSNGEYALYKLIRENNIGSINVLPPAGLKITFDRSLIVNATLFDKNTLEDIFYVTADPPTVNYELRDDDGKELRDDGGAELRD